MDAFWSDYIWPFAVIVAESVLLLVILLIAVAYVIYADRKIWAAVQIRRGPNVVGPWGLFQSFADLIKFVLKEPVIPAGANKGVFLLAPLDHLHAGARRLGGHSRQRRLGHRRHQCRRALHLRHLLARRLRRDHGRLGVEFEISVPGRAALGGADGLLRGLDRLRHHHRAALGRLAQSHGRRRGAEYAVGTARLVLAAAPADVRDLLRLGASGDQPAPVRPGRGGIGACRRLHGRVRLLALHDAAVGRVRGDHQHVRHGDDPVPRRLAAAVPGAAVHLGPRRSSGSCSRPGSCSSCSPW